MNKRLNSVILLALVIAGVIPAAVHAQPPRRQAADVLLSTALGQDRQAAVAYNASTHQFLAVWYHAEEIYGQRFTKYGEPRGGTFAINTATGQQRAPSTACNPDDGTCLVVWEDRRIGSDSDIYGQLLNSDGTLQGSEIVIQTGAGAQERPDLDYDGNRYLVVWQSDAQEIYGRFVQTDGVVDSTLLSIGASGPLDRQRPAVAFNAPADEYLVVYQAGEDATAQIIGRRIYPNEVLPGVEYTIVARSDAGRPDVAAPSTGGYVVVWDDKSGGTFSDVFGQVVQAGADDAFVGGPFGISTAYSGQDTPAISRSPTTGQFLVAWTDTRSGNGSGMDIYAQRLRADASLAGTNFAVNSTAGSQYSVAIAASAQPDIYLLAWEDDRSGEYEIYGQRVAWTGSLLWYDFAISAEPDNQGWHDVAYNPATDEYMAVWVDSHLTETSTVYAQRLSATGLPLEPPQPVDCGGFEMNPTISTDGSFWFVAWEDETDLNYAYRYASGGAFTCVGVPDSLHGDTPQLASGSGTGRHLMVWDREGDIYAGILVAAGLYYMPTVLSSGEPDQWNPNAAYDPEHERFLVVWEQMVGEEPCVMGRLITPYNEIVSGPILIASNDDYGLGHPVAVYNPTDDEYLVVYQQDDGDGDLDVYGRRVTWEGAPIGSGEFAIEDQPPGADRQAPDAIYLPAANRYYVMWGDSRNLNETGYDLYGRWLEADGSPVGPSRPFFRYPSNQSEPALAYDYELQQALAVWVDDRRYYDGLDVHARLGALDVTPPTAQFFHVPFRGQPGTTFTFTAWPSLDDLTPPGALYVRWDLNNDGTFTPWSLDKVVTRTVLLPDIYTVTLQVRDLMSYTAEISHPVVVQAAGGKAPTATLTVDTNYGTAGATGFEFDASGSTGTGRADLQVRWDWESDGVWDTGWNDSLTANHTFTGAGEQMVRAEVLDQDGLTSAAFFNVTVLPNDPVRLEISPPETAVGPGLTVQFQATAWDSYDNEMFNLPLAWSVADPTAGTIGAGGLFTAGLAAGRYGDAVVATWDGVSDTATITIIYPYDIYLPLIFREF